MLAAIYSHSLLGALLILYLTSTSTSTSTRTSTGGLYLCLRRLRGWLYTLLIVVSLLLAFACDVYHGQFMVCCAWAGGPGPTYLSYLAAFMHLVCTSSRHKLCLACSCVANCVLAGSAFLLFVCHASVTFLAFCRKRLDRISSLMFCTITPSVSQFLHCHYCCIHGFVFMLLDVMSFMFFIWCVAIQLLDSILASAITPHALVATRSLVGGHCLAYSCLGVFLQFCCFSPCLWLEVPFPDHRYTITGFLKNFHVSCQRFPAFRVVAAQQKIYIYIVHLYMYTVCVCVYICVCRRTPKKP